MWKQLLLQNIQIFIHDFSSFVGTAEKTDLYKNHHHHIHVLLFCDGYDIKNRINIFSRVSVTTDRVWIANWIY